ncbi:BMP family ABC transporter substrate-binding protein [Siculibacillus lacustris]|uniref:BMP family ABC transporter substrate-binding protein n=1 Tax=Siculibacillus lacustris TaxID=1549641 RepID=A0A4Q9VQJ8_9HYPH|nr:BMP family ABC transporter substrate-binding protein [Siculibacillus lacustris]TBW37237.1 BMP family ABC transporter substrate-binding protein [Siculibacillus lacustris]
MRSALLGSVALATGLGGPALAADKLKAAWVYVGPVGDFGYSYQHDQGRLAVEKALGDKVQTSFVENVPEGPDAERAIERLARDGNKLIFTTSFGFMDPTIKVAKKFPNVHFEHATGYKKAENVAIYNARFYEGRYVIGQIAGKMTKSNTIGYIVSFPIPEVVSGINSFMLGAQSVNPNVKIKVVWVNSWYDPGKEADAAKVLIGQGADILTQHTDSTAALQVAQEKGILAFGQSSDMGKFAPKTQITSIVDDWATYYISRVKLELEGKWASADTWDGIAKGAVFLPEIKNVPADVKAMAEKTIAAIKSGTLKPFGGTITKQDGTTVKDLDDGAILGMNWYVKGIDDKLPQ